MRTILVSIPKDILDLFESAAQAVEDIPTNGVVDPTAQIIRARAKATRALDALDHHYNPEGSL